MIGLNGGLIGKPRSVYTNKSIWTPNEQRLSLFDPFWDNVTLLLHMNGSNGSTTFTDSSKYGLTVTSNGNAQISTTQSKFGGASGKFDGTGDYLTQASDTSKALGVSDFTIETWIYLNSYTDLGIWESCPIGAAGSRTTGFIWYITSTGSMRIYHNSANLIITATSILALNTWTHIACTRQDGTTRLFVNGTSVGSTTTLINDTAGGRVIGTFCDSTSLSPDGYLDEFRITKGVARYSASFTVPDKPFSDA